ncbi:MAG: ATP-binding protein [Polyangiales bacterium]
MSGWDKPILTSKSASADRSVQPSEFSAGSPVSRTPEDPTPPIGANRTPDTLPPQETFVVRQAVRKLEDLVVPSATSEELLTLIERVRHHHTLYVEWGLRALDPNGGRTVINLYGPPGTGKTLAAEAIAQHLGMPFLDVNYAELESKYVGETGKNIMRAFDTARTHKAVLFFDEADSVLGKRLVEVRQSADHGVNQSRSIMLKQLEAFDGVVIFATNMAKNYDGAFVRRILGHVYFGLPGPSERQRLWQRYLLPSLPRADGVTAEALAELGGGLSGGELLNALVGAASQAVRREGEARRLTLEDLAQHISRVKRARDDIGDYQYERVQMKERILSREELPESVREKLPVSVVHESDIGRQAEQADGADRPHSPQ